MIKRKFALLSNILITNVLSSCLVFPDYFPDSDPKIAHELSFSVDKLTLHFRSTYSIPFTLDVPESKETYYWRPLNTDIIKVSESGTVEAQDVAGETKLILEAVNRERKENLTASIDIKVVSNEEFFKINSKNEISGILDTSVKSVKLPETLNNMPITAIAADAFYNCKNLETLTIPNTYTHLNDHCFDGLSSLKNLLLPTGLKYFGPSYGFLKNLTDVRFGGSDVYRNNSNTYRLGDNRCFLYKQDEVYIDPDSNVREFAKLVYGWGDLATIPTFVGSGIGIEEICEGALYGLDTMPKTLRLPESIRVINRNAFAYSTPSQIILPSSLTDVKNGALANMPNVESITITSTNSYSKNRKYFVADNGLYEVTTIPKKDDPNSTMQVLNLVCGCKRTVFYGTTNEIYPYCFDGANFGSGNLVLSANITAIGKNAFRNNPNLKSIVLRNEVQKVDEETYEDRKIRGYDIDGNYYSMDVPPRAGPFYLCRDTTLRVPFAPESVPSNFCSTWNEGVSKVEYNYVYNNQSEEN